MSDLARQSIVTEIERAKTAWQSAPGGYVLNIEYDNRPSVDLTKQVDPYLMVDILWGRSAQLDLGTSPMVADFGTIVLAAGVKEGGGTASLLKLLSHFRPYLQLRDNLGPVRTQAGHLGLKPLLVRGFYYQTLEVPFWLVAQASAVPT